MSKRLTEIGIERMSVKPKGYIVYDAVAPGLGIKITPTGKRLWILQAVYPGHTVQARRTLGPYSPTLGVEAARARASVWRSWIKAGVDPTTAEA